MSDRYYFYIDHTPNDIFQLHLIDTEKLELIGFYQLEEISGIQEFLFFNGACTMARSLSWVLEWKIGFGCIHLAFGCDCS